MKNGSQVFSRKLELIMCDIQLLFFCYFSEIPDSKFDAEIQVSLFFFFHFCKVEKNYVGSTFGTHWT